ncbi:NorD Nitric oxide reductase activation protein [Oceaniovalibus guishaninsula JLT2003]|uniref:NorD Nitric oxide reductase activation protein n=1 Tax=Oceaniovalibus guishaninsula JLT2003 TaxID=1231392 RepID=K2GQ94_9RHOB|nr:VWA domain-containing protein [Oceaniovalibus guishaninsula]EKE44841.1 NorD Nitric oxide reductase activation protein [Oceaniovalibus guishaninsula JLT2003]
MAFRPLDLLDPEETVGHIWHDLVEGVGASASWPEAAVALDSVRPSLAVLFRALGGTPGVELREAVASPALHRRSMRRRLGTGRETLFRAAFDGEALALPPTLDCFPDRDLNRAAYLWLTALAACCTDDDLPQADSDAVQIAANARLTERALTLCPGLRDAHAAMAAQALAARPRVVLPPAEAATERAVRAVLRGEAPEASPEDAARGHLPFAPVPIWLHLARPGRGAAAGDDPDGAEAPDAVATTTRKMGLRRDLAQANRKDSLIVHRFESILSWVESLNISRNVDDDDDENAKKAAEDQDNITLTRNDKRAATRLRLHLDLSPADADHERLAGAHTYPEWNHRSRSYLDAHVRVLEAEARRDPGAHFTPDPRRAREVRRQFEALHPRRILQPRQIDGTELDLDALIAAQADLAATGQGSDRVWKSARQTERDLSVAFLIDTSRSTEAAVGETCVIDVARDALGALVGGIGAAGDRLGIWGFSSLRRDRVFVTRCKGFDDPLDQRVLDNIGALKPGHYTRLGAAIRHASARLAEEGAARKLLLVLTDGKPNDLDHYEGRHGIEDSRMAVIEARRAGQTVHAVIVDEDGQDWFARIFGRGGFHLLPYPARLTRALPDIYRTLTTEV